MKPASAELKRYTIDCLYNAIRVLEGELAAGESPEPTRGLCWFCMVDERPYRNLCLELTERRFGDQVFLQDWLVRNEHITWQQYGGIRYRASKGLLRKLARTRILLAYDLIKEIEQMK